MHKNLRKCEQLIVENFDDFLQIEPVIYKYKDFGYDVFISLEGLSPSKSIKFKTAVNIINQLELQYGKENLKTKSIIESSSGNLAIALAQICKERKYNLTIVVDPLVSPSVLKYIELYQVNVVKVTEKDMNQGYLLSRIEKVKELISSGDYIWTNQYENPANVEAHNKYTAQALYKIIPNPDFLFLGAGTCGTLTGVSSFYKKHSPKTKIIAVDVEGSIIFGKEPKTRLIPGMGAGKVPQNLDLQYIDEIIWITEKQTISMIAKLRDDTGILFGGSTGTIMAAILNYFNESEIKPKKVLTISPDFGDKYIDIYQKLEIKNEL